jgi:polar amino acid transport system permease protein
MYFLEQLSNWKFYLVGAYPTGELGGLLLNILLAAIALSVSFVLAIILGYGRLSRNIFIRYPFSWFIDIIRATPLLMIVFWLYFFLPYIFGSHITVFQSAAFALCIYGASYQAEIVRAGILAVPKGQMEAALTIGLSKYQAMREVIIPQAFKIMLPSFVSFFVSLFKDTSIAYIIGVVELTQSGVIVSQRQPNRIYAAYLCVAIGFWIVSYSISHLASRLEKKMGTLEVTVISPKGRETA